MLDLSPLRASGEAGLVRAYAIAGGVPHYMMRPSLLATWGGWGHIPKPTPENPRNQTEGEIEVVAVTGNRVLVAGEAKWTREPVGLTALNHLREVAAHVPGVTPDTHLFLFGREFDERLRRAAQAEGVRLVDVNELYGGNP